MAFMFDPLPGMFNRPGTMIYLLVKIRQSKQGMSYPPRGIRQIKQKIFDLLEEIQQSRRGIFDRHEGIQHDRQRKPYLAQEKADCAPTPQVALHI